MKGSWVLLSVALAAACGHKPGTTAAAATPTGDSATSSATPAAAPAQVTQEATQLGREVFELVDKTMGYYSAHFGDFPRNVNAIGVDSLTSTTVRRLAIHGKVPTITAAYRHPAGHAITSCSGTNKVLEDSMLNGGPYTVDCTLADGSLRAITVGG
ncbi:MAG TPA: hypothetical protein VGR60_02815 [Gemmatimonadales bacterium]|nr:hypothetical protein [Gemmatimonadales bacterium]